jgi:uncharacterized protein
VRDHTDSRVQASEAAAGRGGAWTPATAVITREVFPGREPDYDDWSRRFLHAVGRIPGYEGATFVGPPHQEPGRRMLILRFTDKASLRRWVDSEQRKALTAESDAFSRHVYEEPSSLETWFTIPGLGAVSPPPRWKMALVTAPAAYVLITAILAVLSPFEKSWAPALTNGVVTVAMIALLTWVAMPLLTRGLRGWLYPPSARPERRPGD